MSLFEVLHIKSFKCLTGSDSVPEEAAWRWLVQTHGGITVDELRAAFPEWHIAWHQDLSVWLAVRGGAQAWFGPTVLIRRELRAGSLPRLAEMLGLQQYFDELDPDELAEVYRTAELLACEGVR